MMIRAGLTLLCTALAAPAFQATVEGPLLGLVHSTQLRALLPVQGMPGAASFGVPLEIGAPVALAAVSSVRHCAIVAPEKEEPTDLLHVCLRSGSLFVEPIADSSERVALLALSPSSYRAAAVLRDRAAVLILDADSERPTPIREVELAAEPGQVTAVAVSDRGDLLIALSTDGEERHTILAFSADSSVPASLLETTALPALSFISGRSEAVITDPANGEVLGVDLDQSGPAPVLLVRTPSALGAAATYADQNRVLLVNPAARSVLVLQRGDGTLAELTCGCTPSSLQRFPGSGVFRVGEFGSGPLWLLDTREQEARLVFVPAYRSHEETAR